MTRHTSKGFWLLGAGLIMTALFGGGGCSALGFGDHCSEKDYGRTACEGNRIRLCCPEDMVWEAQGDCGALTCVEEGSEAVCATSESRDPRCERAPGAFCDNGQAFSCTAGGHAVPGETCGDNDIATACVVEQGEAFCAEASAPDPSCVPSRTKLCEDDTLVSCHLGFRVWHHDCVNTCVTAESDSFCALDSEPDPICTSYAVCDDGNVVLCRDGYRISDAPCASGQCGLENDYPTCIESTELDARCAPEGESTYCDGSALVWCAGGYVRQRTYCAPDACNEAGDRAAECGPRMP